MAKFKVESGMQLLARLRRRPDIQNFYPVLFENGPKPGEVIEIIFREDSASHILVDLICEALMPTYLGGVEAGVLFFNTDGNMDFQLLENNLRRKLQSRVANNTQEQRQYTDEDLNHLLLTTFNNFYVLEIYDAMQLYTTLHNLDNILAKHSNISLVLFDTLTAFYWSEQRFKITKMDVYIKNLLRMIQKISKEYKITILYTRPEYFSSSKDAFENLEMCSEQPTLEHVNYRLQIITTDDCSYQVNVQSFSKFNKKSCSITPCETKWF